MTTDPPAYGAPSSSAVTRRSYDAVAERYAVEIAGELDAKPLDRALLDTFVELTSDGPVVDVGCGPGHATAYLAGRGARALGVDLSPAMCAVGHRGTALPFAAADMTVLPVRSGAAAGILCWYAVIHLDEAGRHRAYAEFARVLRPGGHVLVAFHVSDMDTRPGQATHLTEWWDRRVDLTFRFLDPEAETAALARAGLTLVARLDRAPHPGAEHPSRRTYLLARRTPTAVPGPS
ncbi:class I SAM-dependent methyltransferase [Streptomyces sp. NPDC008313]|uniref:class I SAM-dependent methyltransferase n=1 Tax=Streptomyces sp. NPDC008313 TaxID=3364826 RepID=UPI0036EEDEF6